MAGLAIPSLEARSFETIAQLSDTHLQIRTLRKLFPKLAFTHALFSRKIHWYSPRFRCTDFSCTQAKSVIAMLKSINDTSCDGWPNGDGPEDWKPDQDISGLGVSLWKAGVSKLSTDLFAKILISAVLTAVLAVLMSGPLFTLEWLEDSFEIFHKMPLEWREQIVHQAKPCSIWKRVQLGRPAVGCFVDRDNVRYWRHHLTTVILGLSDQQLLTGLIILCIAFAKYDAISIYDFSAAADVAYFSIVTHAVSLFTLMEYFWQKRWLYRLRVLLILSTFIMLVACMIFGHRAWYYVRWYDRRTLGYSMACFWSDKPWAHANTPNFLMWTQIVFVGWMYWAVILHVLIYRTETAKARAALSHWPFRNMPNYRQRALDEWYEKWASTSTGGWFQRLRRPSAALAMHYTAKRQERPRYFAPLDLIIRFAIEVCFPRKFIFILLITTWIIAVILMHYDYSYALELGGDWEFGQVFAVAVIALPFMSLANLYAGTPKCPGINQTSVRQRLIAITERKQRNSPEPLAHPPPQTQTTLDGLGGPDSFAASLRSKPRLRSSTKPRIPTGLRRAPKCTWKWGRT